MGDGPDAVEIGRRIAELRRAAGIRQKDLAERVGLVRTSIANIEAGRQGQPLLKHLRSIAEVLGSSVAEITGAPAMPWLALARRNQQARLTYDRLAEQCWQSHDYLTAIRYRGIAEGLAMAQTHHVEVVQEADRV